MSGGKKFKVLLMDERVTDKDERSTLIDVDTAAELGAYLHGIYHISKNLAKAYGLVVTSGGSVQVNLSSGSTIHLWVSDVKAADHRLRHPHVLHPSGRTYMQRLQDEEEEREIAAYAAMVRRSRARQRAP